MSGLNTGDLAMCYDDSGSMIDLVIFLEMCEPYTLSRNEVEDRNFWHYKVIMPDGMTRFMSTFCFTLQKV
jgi:hypothetical protein